MRAKFREHIMRLSVPPPQSRSPTITGLLDMSFGNRLLKIYLKCQNLNSCILSNSTKFFPVLTPCVCKFQVHNSALLIFSIFFKISILYILNIKTGRKAPSWKINIFFVKILLVNIKETNKTAEVHVKIEILLKRLSQGYSERFYFFWTKTVPTNPRIFKMNSQFIHLFSIPVMK